GSGGGPDTRNGATASRAAIRIRSSRSRRLGVRAASAAPTCRLGSARTDRARTYLYFTGAGLAVMMRVPFNRPVLTGSEMQYMRNAIDNLHISGDGPFAKKVHALIESLTGAHKALLTTSCTHALEMTALLLDVGPGDEVILPSFTFVSTAT